MIEPNWGNFKAKFCGKEQSSFEWFCYLLFCKKFNLSEGIPRYVNHAGVETNPIDVNGEKISWQAKFCTKSLSNYKTSFIHSINIAKDRYPELNKIFFYTNRDFGQHRTG